MKTIHGITFLGFLVMSCASCQDRSAIKVTLETRDDTGMPLEGAVIETNVFDRWQPGENFGKDVYERFNLVTDVTGTTVLETSSSRCELVFSANKPGYYWGGAAFKSAAKMNDRWQPWNPTLKIELKRILNPIPLVAKKVLKGRANYVPLPAFGAPVGFDFEVGDWTSPYGRGTTADIFIQLDGQTNDLVNLYDAQLRITFSNPGDGLVLHETEPSGLRVPHHAPISGYQPELVKRKAQVKGDTVGVLKDLPKTEDDSKPNENYFLRVRTRLDGAGEVVSANYAKVYGGFLWYVSGKVQFQYYYNPVTNDRNLEFAPKRNLLTLPEDQQVSDP